jgi:hypothetical protein
MHHQTSVSPAISPARPAPDTSPSALRMAMLRAVHGLLDEPSCCTTRMRWTFWSPLWPGH